MKVSLVWSSPKPERTIAVAMRRCYSTKTIEEIESELEQKGAEYWKYLLTKCLQDKSLDVLEHFTLSLMVEGMSEAEAVRLVGGFPYSRVSSLGADSWLVSLNARTLVEMWREPASKRFAESVVSELDSKQVCPVFNQVVFGERADAR
ncbi:MAG TPA: FAD-dependent thymidylate synthase [Nitrososphaerales archaeon]|nr:FAD-dependent thymidylate synthase [Nitrososphaerales archaeon]